MELSYLITEEDYVQFNINATEKIKSYQRTIKLMRFWKNAMLVCMIVLFILLVLDYNKSNLALFTGSIVVFLSSAYYPKLMAHSIRKNALSIASMNSDSILGDVSLEISEGWISTIKKSSERRVKLTNIKNVTSTRDHIFIYISDVEAFIIPRCVFDSKMSEEKFLSLLGYNGN